MRDTGGYNSPFIGGGALVGCQVEKAPNTLAPKSLLAAQLGELGNTNDRLEATIAHLEEVLGPVLAPPAPTVEPGQQPPPVADQLARDARTSLEAEVGALVARAEALRRRLASLLDRVRL